MACRRQASASYVRALIHCRPALNWERYMLVVTKQAWFKKSASMVQISGKNLGALALEDCCERCYYLKLRMQNKLPFSTFPGIFSTIDSWTKRLVRDWFEETSEPPQWLKELGQIRPCVRVPGHTDFRTFIPKHNVLLTGAPDELFIRDGKLIIADYKTARYTRGQDNLLPLYEVQLNAYAKIAQELGFSPIAGLFLIYMEPLTTGEDIFEGCCTDEGMIMKFAARPVRLPLNIRMIEPLLARTRELYDLKSPPPGLPDCKDCGLLEQLMSEVEGRAYSR